MEEKNTYQYSDAIDPQRKKRSPLIMIIFTVFTLALLGSIGYYAYSTLTFTPKPKETTQTAVTQPKKETTTITADDTIKGLADALKASAVDYEGTTPSYQIKDYEFATDLGVKTQSVSVERVASESQTALSSVRDYLKSKNFNESVKKDDRTSFEFDAEYKSEAVICGVKRFKLATASISSGYSVSAACADAIVYQDVAKTQRPFYELFVKERNADIALKSITLVGKPEYTNSPVIGYMQAELAMRLDNKPGRALFYQTPDKVWHHFKYLSEGIDLSCSDFKTPDQKRAYAESECPATANRLTPSN